MREEAGCLQRGQVVPLVALLIVLAGVTCLVAGKLGGAAVARAQAATAADAAALAGAAAGRNAALEAAAANGGAVTRYQERGTDARVEVELGRATAAAQARRSGVGQAGLAGGGGGGSAPAMRAALARAAQLLGRTEVPVVPSPAGAVLPGDAAARHEVGLAVDVPLAFVGTLAPVAAGAGLCQPYPDVHPVHFEVCGYGLP